jgi:hypothetical protein
VRLGEGSATAISPDGKRVLAIVHPTTDQQLVIYPTGPGEARRLPFPTLRVLDAVWLPDNRRILMTAAEPGHGERVYLVDPDGGAPRPVTPEGFGAGAGKAGEFIDATRFIARGPDGRLFLCSIEGGAPVAVPGFNPADLVVGPSGREGWVYIRRGRELPAHVVLFELASGREEEVKDFVPAELTGNVGFYGLRLTRDGRYYAYSYASALSDLYLVEGVR